MSNTSERAQTWGIGIEQLFAGVLVEFGRGGNLLQQHHEAGLRAAFVQRVGYAVIQGIKVLVEVGRKAEPVRARRSRTRSIN